jgi:hypothetical protein
MNDRERSSLTRVGILWSLKVLWPVQPNLDGPIHFSSVTAFKRSAHTSQMRRI